MIRLSLHLPAKLRLDLTLVKSRKNLDETPIIPNLGKILRAKTGNKVSRFFRHVFENKKIRKLMGANFALLIAASGFLPNKAIEASTIEENTINAPIVIQTQTGIQYPVDSIKITQRYHFFHPGIDFDGVTGDPIRPISAGKVVSVGYSRFGYGNAVLINHSGGITSFYAHLSEITVQEGESVDMNSTIGEMGATGRAFGDHLHLEVYENGKAINPLAIL